MSDTETHMSESSWISVKTVLPIIAAIVGAAVWIVTTTNGAREEFKDGLNELRTEQRVMQTKHDTLSEALGEIKDDLVGMRADMSNNRWTHADMIRWASRLRVANPSMSVPEVD